MSTGRPSVLCPPCEAEWAAWLDYRLPRQRHLSVHGGNPVLATLESIAATGRQWAETIRAQQELIEQHCAEQHQSQRKREAHAA